MTTSALIDLVLSYTDQISPTDADNATRRARLLQYAQEIFDDVWNYREWRFKLTSGTVTVLNATNNIVVPSNWLDSGSEGAAYDSTGRKLTEIPAQSLLKWRQLANNPSNTPIDSFSLFDYDATTGRPLFQIPSTASGNQTYTLWYNRTGPTLGDSTTPSVSNLHFIPAQYHNTVLLPGVAAKTRKAKGDTRDWQGAYKEGLAYMVLRERPRKTTVHKLPIAISGSW